MSGSVNKAILVGRCGSDPEIKRLQSGKPVANIRLATSEHWRDKSGERQERTTWHTIVIFSEGLCRVAEQYLRKGSMIYVEGSIANREYEDRDGNKRWKSEIVLQGFNSVLTMLDSPKGEGRDRAVADQGQLERDAPQRDLDDSVPF